MTRFLGMTGDEARVFCPYCPYGKFCDGSKWEPCSVAADGFSFEESKQRLLAKWEKEKQRKLAEWDVLMDELRALQPPREYELFVEGVTDE